MSPVPRATSPSPTTDALPLIGAPFFECSATELRPGHVAQVPDSPRLVVDEVSIRTEGLVIAGRPVHRTSGRRVTFTVAEDAPVRRFATATERAAILAELASAERDGPRLVWLSGAYADLPGQPGSVPDPDPVDPPVGE